jgi:hypothetical protein
MGHLILAGYIKFSESVRHTGMEGIIWGTFRIYSGRTKYILRNKYRVGAVLY